VPSGNRRKDKEPFPKPILPADANQAQYKQFMIESLEYQAWENRQILIRRKIENVQVGSSELTQMQDCF